MKYNYSSTLKNINLSGFVPVSGVYKIVNLITGKTYIGSSIDVYSRLTQHVRDFLLHNHTNADLSNDISLYGLRSFEVSVIEECESGANIVRVEMDFIGRYREMGIELYNIIGCQG